MCGVQAAWCSSGRTAPCRRTRIPRTGARCRARSRSAGCWTRTSSKEKSTAFWPPELWRGVGPLKPLCGVEERFELRTQTLKLVLQRRDREPGGQKISSGSHALHPSRGACGGIRRDRGQPAPQPMRGMLDLADVLSFESGQYPRELPGPIVHVLTHRFGEHLGVVFETVQCGLL